VAEFPIKDGVRSPPFNPFFFSVVDFSKITLYIRFTDHGRCGDFLFPLIKSEGADRLSVKLLNFLADLYVTSTQLIIIFANGPSRIFGREIQLPLGWIKQGAIHKNFLPKMVGCRGISSLLILPGI